MATTVQDHSRAGYLYVMRDQCAFNIIKVGRSVNPINRVSQLYRTGNPLPFTLSQLWWTQDMFFAERIAHLRLADHRITPRREFFEIAPQHQCWEWEYKCEEVTDSFLGTLIELIEQDLCATGMTFFEADIPMAYAHHQNNFGTLPLWD